MVIVCTDDDCRKAGGKAILKRCKRHLKDKKYRKTTLLLESKCTGACEQGPIVGLQPANEWLTEASASSVVRFLNETLEGGG